MYYVYLNDKSIPLERLRWVKLQPNGVYAHCLESEGQGIIIGDEIYHVAGRGAIDKPSVDLVWKDDLSALLAQTEAQAVVAAYSVGAEVELTPEILALATASAPVKELKAGEEWRVGVFVSQGTPVTFSGKSYACIKDHLTQDNWNPERATGHLWELDTGGEGTPDNPIPFVLGMGVKQGLCYSYGGKLWAWDAPDMPACSWAPGSAGVWQWKEWTEA